MHILVTNDDGPPSYQSSPYIQSLVSTLQANGHTVSVVLPHIQRSWIGKAHMVGQTLTPSYYRPGTVLKDDGTTQDRPFNDGKEEWVLLDGTPASCVQIGLHYLFNEVGPIDLVISGPNYGRNTTAVFALSSGTIGGAMEGAHSGKKSIALSYAFDSRDHDAEIIAGASKVGVKLIEKLVREWPEDVHLYSINVPVRKDVEQAKIVYTDMLQNRWTSGSSFAVLPSDANDADPNLEELKIREGKAINENQKDNHRSKRGHVTFKWAPNFADVRKSVEEAQSGDGWHVIQGHVTVTPLRANFWHLPHYTGEIKLDLAHSDSKTPTEPILALVDYPEPYVQPLILQALSQAPYAKFNTVTDSDELEQHQLPSVQFTAYETLDFDHSVHNPTESLICAYVIRKALIRKHFLSNTVSTWLAKHPQSILGQHCKPSIHFELDYAEFLDDALVDAWDLHESMARNEKNNNDAPLEWWILKPGMSDGGNGIKLFSNLEQLQAIFSEWDPDSDEEEDSGENIREPDDTDGIMTSQLRHFLIQPYIDPPLLLPSHNGRKFHIRTYVLAVGALKVFVYNDMLALFAARPYISPACENGEPQIDLRKHLTNTCFQDTDTRATSVYRFWDLDEKSLPSTWQDDVYDQICEIVGDVFEAASREQMVHFQAIPNAFEIFGVDFLVDATLNVWLLEVNAYPDFKQTGEQLQPLVAGLFSEVVRVAVEPFFGYRQHENGTQAMKLVRNINLGRR